MDVPWVFVLWEFFRGASLGAQYLTVNKVSAVSEYEVVFSLHRHPVLLYQTDSHDTEQHICVLS